MSTLEDIRRDVHEGRIQSVREVIYAAARGSALFPNVKPGEPLVQSVAPDPLLALRLQEAQTAYDAFHALSREELLARYHDYLLEEDRQDLIWEEAQATGRSTTAESPACAAMLERVKAWKPPRKLEWLKEGIVEDVLWRGLHPDQHGFRSPHPRPPFDEWVAAQLKRVREDLRIAKARLLDAMKNCRKYNKQLQAFYASIAELEQQLAAPQVS